MTEPAALLTERLGIEIEDDSLLGLALVHPSYRLEHGTPSNQRLEFLGDAVLGMVVAESLYLTHPDLDEGSMSKARIALVNESVLAELAREIDLGSLLLMGKGAGRSGDAELDSVLADAFEAVVGAVYLTAGLQEARRLVLSMLGERIEIAAADPGAGDFKSRLNEWAQAVHGAMPSYDVTRSGPEHAPEFVATLSVRGEVLSTGHGRSKKLAETAAAKAALEEVRGA